MKPAVACSWVCLVVAYVLIWNCYNLLFVYLPGSYSHVISCDSLWLPCLLSFTLHIVNTNPVYFCAHALRGLVTTALSISELQLSCCLSSSCNKGDVSYFYSRQDLKSNDLVFLKENNQLASRKLGITNEQDVLNGASQTWLALGAPMATCWWYREASISIQPCSFLLQGFISSFSFFFYFLLHPLSYFTPVTPLSPHCFLHSLVAKAETGGDAGAKFGPLVDAVWLVLCFNSNYIWRSLNMVCVVQFMPPSPPLSSHTYSCIHLTTSLAPGLIHLIIKIGLF